jgi:hypothetical protein
MIELAAAWILSVQLTRGGEFHVITFATEQQCVATGEKLYEQARARAIKEGKRPPPGWTCIEGAGVVVETRT